MQYEYKTTDTCSQTISFDIDGNKISNITFYGGCNGNLKAVSKLVQGMTVEEIEDKVDVLFWGCSCYAFDVDENVKEFIKENRDKIGKIVCFGTSAMMKSVYKPMKKWQRNMV